MASSKSATTPKFFSTTSTSKPSHIQPLLFDALSPDGSNYLEWHNDINTYLSAKDLAATLSPTPIKDLPIVHK